MRRLLCAALAATALLALPSAASAAAPLVVGIGEQTDGIFSEPRPGSSSSSRDVRYIVAWDALRLQVAARRDRRTTWRRRATPARACCSASATRARAASAPQALPSPRRFRREFLRFRARYPWIKEYLTWNEANHCGQPTWNHPKRRRPLLRHRCATHCRGCTIVGPSVLDATKMPRWVKRSRRPPSTASASGRCTTTSTPTASARAARARCCARRKAKIWFTETGGLVRRDNGSTIEFAESTEARGRRRRSGCSSSPA